MANFQDREYLQESQYRTSRHLTARADLHRRFNVSTDDWHDWAFAQIELRNGETILECGAGPGWLWKEPQVELPAEFQLVATDLSAGMMAEARQRLADLGTHAAFANADIQNLPCPTDTFDAIVANHMLYHVPDLDKALAEVTRALKPDGRFIAATNGRGHMREVFEIGGTLMPGVYLGLRGAMQALPFALENGAELLGRHFDDIEVRLYDSHLEVDDAEALINYMLSSAEGEAAVPPNLRQAAITQLQQEIDANGPIYISKETGVFVARSPHTGD
ncbi:MAG: class I SAM-dependent methyltransferase [Chloroflexota bacterium]